MNEAVGKFERASGADNPPPGSRTDRAVNSLRTADVIATGCSTMVLFEAQTPSAASWLSARCGAQLDNVYDQVRVDLNLQDQLVRELKAAGFKVIRQTI